MSLSFDLISSHIGTNVGTGIDMLSNIRNLQTIPDYTSPPSPYAISLTPDYYQPDSVIDFGRELASQNMCSEDEHIFDCQIPFYPSIDAFEPSSVGVIFYGGALVDPRGYSPVAHQLAERYGIPVVVPIFHRDLAYGFVCAVSGRIELAKKAFPHVEKWVLAGHSFGGIAAAVDLLLTNTADEVDNSGSISIDDIAGLAMIGSYLNPQAGCGVIDFSASDIPMASISASKDFVLNRETFDMTQGLYPQNHTLSFEIQGGNHGQFGSYDDSERRILFGQNDGNATIPETLQHDMTVGGIMNVASRAGMSLLPKVKDPLSSSKKSKKSKKQKVKKGSKKSKKTKI